jgi:hypothetical protein
MATKRFSRDKRKGPVVPGPRLAPVWSLLAARGAAGVGGHLGCVSGDRTDATEPAPVVWYSSVRYRADGHE